jgi:hypothetical protein
VPIIAHAGEYVLTAAQTKLLFKNAPRFDTGGFIGPSTAIQSILATRSLAGPRSPSAPVKLDLNADAAAFLSRYLGPSTFNNLISGLGQWAGMDFMDRNDIAARMLRTIGYTTAATSPGASPTAPRSLAPSPAPVVAPSPAASSTSGKPTPVVIDDTQFQSLVTAMKNAVANTINCYGPDTVAAGKTIAAALARA